MIDTPAANVADTPALFETYYERMCRYIASMIHDPDEAEDLAQETFLRAFQQRDSLRNQEAVIGWLYRIATNVCLDRLRQRARRAPLESETDLDDIPIEADTPSPEQTTEQNEMSACVQQYLADLPDDYRSVILLQDMYGLTGPEIAELLGVSLATAKIRLHRGRKRLRAALEAGCTFSHDECDVLVCEPKP
jgi:RNA polymerase sigma-70 factor (ECF subfamily)